MSQDVIELTKKLIAFPSVSRQSNAPISDYIQDWLTEAGATCERLEYTDPNGELKVNIIAKFGEGTGGLAFCSHSDTVPGQEQDWPAFDPEIKGDRLYGRGACDMKGPLAATMIAARNIDASKLKEPVYVVVTADEEIGLLGAKYCAENSEMLKRDKPTYGVIAEPTTNIPVYAHKGGGGAVVTAHGRAAHTSTDKGDSAVFKLIPFMNEMVQLRERTRTEAQFLDPLFDPPTNGFNMTMTDFNVPGNVTAPKAQCRVSFRGTPNTNNEELLGLIVEVAEKYGLDYQTRLMTPLYVPTDSDLVKAAVKALDGRTPETVPYGTDGIYLQHVIPQMVVLGPGDIGVAHTVGESIPLDELTAAVGVYESMIHDLCM